VSQEIINCIKYVKPQELVEKKNSNKTNIRHMHRIPHVSVSFFPDSDNFLALTFLQDSRVLRRVLLISLGARSSLMRDGQLLCCSGGCSRTWEHVPNVPNVPNAPNYPSVPNKQVNNLNMDSPKVDYT